MEIRRRRIARTLALIGNAADRHASEGRHCPAAIISGLGKTEDGERWHSRASWGCSQRVVWPVLALERVVIGLGEGSTVESEAGSRSLELG